MKLNFLKVCSFPIRYLCKQNSLCCSWLTFQYYVWIALFFGYLFTSNKKDLFPLRLWSSTYVTPIGRTVILKGLHSRNKCFSISSKPSRLFYKKSVLFVWNGNGISQTLGGDRYSFQWWVKVTHIQSFINS